MRALRTLFLDLASHSGALACVEADHCASSLELPNRATDDQLITEYERAMSEAGWKQEDLDRIACISGPGGFTSLRVAVAFANALSYALDIPTCGIHLSDLYQARSSEKNFLWLHSTKKHELFVRGFGAFAVQFPEAQCVPLETFIAGLQPGTAWVGELIPEHAKAAEEKGALKVPVGSLSYTLPSLLASQTYGRKNLEPWYGRGW